MTRHSPVLLPLLGGLIFVIVFHWAYSGIKDNMYQVRDDGVITVSHARNLVEYGFIGINPSGGRVEGYSAPVQFFLFAGVYAVTGIGYAAYAAAQTVVATFLLSALFVLFLRERKILALILAALAALFLAYLRPFIQWHGSGMENPVTHVLFLAAVLVLFSLARSGRIDRWRYLLAIPVFLASISRIDSIYHIGPLLVIFAVFWLIAFRNRRGVYFSFIVFGLWALFQVWRYLYFGDLLPNTAYAQSISILDNLRPWLRFDIAHIYGATVRAGVLLAVHGGYVLLLALTPLLLARAPQTALLLILIGSLTLTAIFSESVFGAARLGYARTTTHLAVFAALGAALLFYCLFSLPNKQHTLWAVPALGAICAGVFVADVAPRHLCCPISTFEPTRAEFIKIAEAEGLPRPIVSNPDLGMMSWHKEFNIVDLGRLGSPIMAKSHGDLLGDYFLNYAAPDIVENHASWYCVHWYAIFSDPRFEQRYQPVTKLFLGQPNCLSGQKFMPDDVWVRRDVLKSSQSAERRLIDRMAANPSAGPLRDELEHCESRGGGG